MELTDKDWEWFDYPALRRRIEHPDEREESSQSQEPAPKPVVRAPKPSPTRIARKLSDRDSNLHFTDAALQQEQLEPKEDDGPTVALKRIVLQAAQEQKLFRVYGGNGVFAESQRLPKRLEPKFNTIFDFDNLMLLLHDDDDDGDDDDVGEGEKKNGDSVCVGYPETGLVGEGSSSCVGGVSVANLGVCVRNLG